MLSNNGFYHFLIASLNPSAIVMTLELLVETLTKSETYMHLAIILFGFFLSIAPKRLRAVACRRSSYQIVGSNFAMNNKDAHQHDNQNKLWVMFVDHCNCCMLLFGCCCAKMHMR